MGSNAATATKLAAVNCDGLRFRGASSCASQLGPKQLPRPDTCSYTYIRLLHR